MSNEFFKRKNLKKASESLLSTYLGAPGGFREGNEEELECGE